MNGDLYPGPGTLPEPVQELLDTFERELDVDLHLWVTENGDRRTLLYPGATADAAEGEEADIPAPSLDGAVRRTISPRDGPTLELQIRGREGKVAEQIATVLRDTIERTYDFAQEIRFFTYELSERYEEINLLYSISETLGSILRLEDAARVILNEVCDVLGAKRGSLWVYQPETDILRLTAHVGEEGIEGPLRTGDPDAITAQVFREGRPLIATREGSPHETHRDVDLGESDSFLSVPIRYTPPTGEARTVGVINLIGRRRGGRFTASDQKLLSAIASQVGAALENNRLIRESLAQERVAREMELAHNLQMKLLPSVGAFEGADVAARVMPAESVGGDFYHLFKLTGGRVGVMIGDVSSHGFPAALIMALAMSAATIYASEFATPSKVLRHLDDALRDELESTEMYLTLFYGVLDAEEGVLTYSNAGHPHAFLMRGDGSRERLGATDPPVGFAGPDSYGQGAVSWQAHEDLLLLFTDGLSDALKQDDEESGEHVVLREVETRLRAPTLEILEALFAAAGQATSSIPADDRSVVVLRS